MGGGVAGVGGERESDCQRRHTTATERGGGQHCNCAQCANCAHCGHCARRERGGWATLQLHALCVARIGRREGNIATLQTSHTCATLILAPSQYTLSDPLHYNALPAKLLCILFYRDH